MEFLISVMVSAVCFIAEKATEYLVKWSVMTKTCCQSHEVAPKTENPCSLHVVPRDNRIFYQRSSMSSLICPHQSSVSHHPLFVLWLQFRLKSLSFSDLGFYHEPYHVKTFLFLLTITISKNKHRPSLSLSDQSFKEETYFFLNRCFAAHMLLCKITIYDIPTPPFQ